MLDAHVKHHSNPDEMQFMNCLIIHKARLTEDKGEKYLRLLHAGLG
jgi:hypothetical protein